MTFTRAVTVVSIAFLLCSCTAWWQSGSRQGVSSSLVDFLYPGGEEPPPVDDRIPRLELPLRVGVAFVPAATSYVEGLPEARKAELLEVVERHFERREYISDIAVIPDPYLRTRRGFDTLDQVARLYDLDVIALISYDQVAIAEDRKSSILYWTIVGAYFVKGSKNDVQTFVDTAVFDVATRSLLLRAPGVNHQSATATLVESSEEMRKARQQGFASAMADMTNNLTVELDRFEQRIKDEEANVVVAQREGTGSGGYGAAEPGPLIALLLLVVAAIVTSPRQTASRGKR